MTRYYRVHPWLPSAADGEPGNGLYVHPHQGSGRIDNPDHYRVMYLADSPAGAVAEAWNNNAVWDDDLLAGPRHLAGSVMAISTYSASATVLDLNEAETLLELGLRPSRVVTRNKSLTQAWALAIFQTRDVSGVRWWSYHDPDWGSLGLWKHVAVQLLLTEQLASSHPAVIEAASILSRRWGAVA
jgi:hypothetical protein